MVCSLTRKKANVVSVFMEKIRFQILLSADEYLRYYNGSASALIVKAEDGRRVQLPAHRFRQFVTKEGIHGHFEIALDDHNKLMTITKLA